MWNVYTTFLLLNSGLGDEFVSFKPLIKHIAIPFIIAMTKGNNNDNNNTTKILLIF